jgi:L-ribulokinase
VSAFTIGVDYGTNSVRSIVVDVATGACLGEAVYNYPTGHQGIMLDKRDHNVARQNPADYLAGLEATVKAALLMAKKKKGFTPDKVIAIGVDTTGSTPIPVDAKNQPLCFSPKFKKEPAAYAWLWKDHTSQSEATKITELAKKHRPHYLAKIGGVYSSEWFWSKLWHCLNTTPKVFDAAVSWVECCDWVPAMLCGITDPKAIKRGICAAGHKALYSDSWKGLPDKKFLSILNPKLAALRDRLYEKAYDGSTTAGTLCEDWAKKLGLNHGVPVAIGAFDAHLGAVGSGVSSGSLVAIIGTSTCHCGVSPLKKPVKDIPGICGIVEGSILPGYYGIEGGQSAVGDIFKWFVEVVCKGDGAMHAAFTKEASTLKPGQSGLLALDWNNGNRNTLVDTRLTGLLVGQTLHTTPAEIYRALIESTAFGMRTIIERLTEFGVPVKKVICCGGIAEKNPMLMQIYADVSGCTMQISASSQSCALGSAVYAAVAAGKKNGGYDSMELAQKHMTSLKAVEYTPNKEAQKVYTKLFGIYKALYDGFGGVTTKSDFSKIMKDLLTIKSQQSA